jgi:hypothetical protein
MVIYINTNSEYVLAGIAKPHLFPVLVFVNISVCIYHHIQMQRVSVMWDQAPQNGRNHHLPCGNDVVRSVASSPAIKNGTV